MRIYILINQGDPTNPVLGVYDSLLLADKRKRYFRDIYPIEDLVIVEESIQYLEMD